MNSQNIWKQILCIILLFCNSSIEMLSLRTWKSSRALSHSISSLQLFANVNEPNQLNSLPSTYRMHLHTNLKEFSKTIFKGIILSSMVVPLQRKNALASYMSTLSDTSQCVINDPIVNSIISQVIKRKNDNRLYRPITLENKLRVLLISDPESSRAAAALDVHVGSFSDPVDIPGLAHFTEHMSFLGNSKYPQEEEFMSFLSTHGGSSNAYTADEDTCYYFDVNAEQLEESLDRFSQFFISPLFTESMTSRELNAIDSEHAKNLNNDGFRIYQLEKDFANPSHPLNRFPTGNKETLESIPKKNGLNTRQALLDFHSKYYSSNIMTLCIVGNQNLDKLEALAKSYFSEIPNRFASDPSSNWAGKISPFLPQESPSQLDIVPVNSNRKLVLGWPVWIQNEEDRKNILKTQPEAILTHLIGHEGKGSLRSYLVDKEWINSIQAAISTDTTDLHIFEISISLTEKGFKNYLQIIDSIYTYIAMLRASDIPRYVFDEVQKLSQIGFEFSEKSSPANYASRLVADMQVYTNPSEYLTGPRVFSHPNACMVRKYLQLLTSEDLRIKLIAKELENSCKSTSKYYPTKFNMRTLPTSQQVHWNKILKGEAHLQSLINTSFTYPQPNQLIAQNFDLYSKQIPKSKRLEALLEHPKVLLSSSKWKLWYKLDSVFEQPKVYSIFTLAIDREKYNASFLMKSRLFSMCLLDYLNEYLYDALLAGLNFSLSFNTRGIEIIFSGFNDKMLVFMENIFQQVSQFQANEKTFNRMKTLIQQELDNWKIQQPYSHASYYLNLATETLQFPIEELRSSLVDISTISLNSFLTNILQESFGEGLVIGNTIESQVMTMASLFDKYFQFKALPQEKMSKRVIKQIPISSNGYYLQRNEPNLENINSATLFSFQLASRDVKSQLMLEIASEQVEQLFYNSLRTQQQLGYIVQSSIRSKDGIYSLIFIVQSAIVNGSELSRRIQSFLDDNLLVLKEISSETFIDIKNGMITRKLEPDQQLTSQAQRFWNEIVIARLRSTELPLFDRDIIEVDILKKISKQEYIDFLQELFSPSGKEHRLIVSEINTTLDKTTTTSVLRNDCILVDDEFKFRDSLPGIP